MLRAIASDGDPVVVTVAGLRASGLPAAVVYALAFTVEFGAVVDRVLRRGGEDRVRLRQALLVDAAASRCSRPRPPSRRGLRPVRRVRAQGLGADPPRRRSTCRSTRPSSTSSLGAALSMPARDRARCAGGSRQSPGTRQTVGEVIYDIAQTQVAETGLPTKAMARWFPYVRDAADLHLRRQPPRVHPAAAHRRDLPRRPGVGDLRGDVVDLGDARARRC